MNTVTMGIVPSEHDPEIRYMAVPDPSVGCEVSAVHSGSAARARGEDVLKTVNSGRFMASIPSYIRDGIYTIDDDGGARRPRRKDCDPEGDARGAGHRSRDQISPDRRKGGEPMAPAAGPAGTRSPDPRGTPRNRLGPAGRENRSRNRSARVVEIPVRGASIDARSEEHTSELQSPCNIVCRLLLEKKKNILLSCGLRQCRTTSGTA